jgi:hypothetical protein
MFRFTTLPKALMALLATLGMAAWGSTARADRPAGGSVEVVNNSKAPVLVVINSGSRGEGANVKAYPAINGRLGLTVGAGKARTISKCFKVGDEITVHVYAVEDGKPTKELYSRRFSSGTPLDLSYPVLHDCTKNFHIAWDGDKLTKKPALLYARWQEQNGERCRQGF